jgi:2-polyprenyl-3-methyl-5-hydroxy-6-metoxy-1,4-benzoquinol methylase
MNTHRKMKSASIERLLPSEIGDSDVAALRLYQLHVERYEFATNFASGRVLDCACGAGYGSNVLMQAGDRVESVTGVDIDPEAVEYAMVNYARVGLTFESADGTKFSGGPFETVVSFETIEHVPDPEALIDNLARLLKPGGIFVASVPVTPSVDINPYHLHDFTQASFRRMFQKRGFSEIGAFLQVQPYEPVKQARHESRLKSMLAYYATHPAALVKRAYSTAVDGFCNKYLACAWQR